MSRQRRTQRRGRALEHRLEGLIYASRWLMAPLYLGLAAALAILVITFFRELAMAIPWRSTPWRKSRSFFWC